MLQAANAIPDDDSELRIIGASELCRGYVDAGLPQRALSRCQRHSRLVRASGDAVALARAQYLEAGALSELDKSAMRFRFGVHRVTGLRQRG